MFRDKYSYIEEIEYAKKIYKEQCEKVKKEEYINESLKNNLILHLREIRTSFQYVNLYNVWKKSADETFEDFGDYKIFKMHVFRELLNNDQNFTIGKVIQIGYEGYTYEVEIIKNENLIRIGIPNPKRISNESLEDSRYGMFYISYEDNRECWHITNQSYKTSDIANAIEEYFKEKENEIYCK